MDFSRSWRSLLYWAFGLAEPYRVDAASRRQFFIPILFAFPFDRWRVRVRFDPGAQPAHPRRGNPDVACTMPVCPIRRSVEEHPRQDRVGKAMSLDSVVGERRALEAAFQSAP